MPFHKNKCTFAGLPFQPYYFCLYAGLLNRHGFEPSASPLSPACYIGGGGGGFLHFVDFKQTALS